MPCLPGYLLSVAVDEFRSYTESAKRGVLLIRSMSDRDVLAGARDEQSAAFQRVMDDLGPNTNPFWITAECATEAYRRRLINELELDLITL